MEEGREVTTSQEARRGWGPGQGPAVAADGPPPVVEESVPASSAGCSPSLTRGRPGARRRRRAREPRDHRLLLRLSTEEAAVIATAASRAGMAPMAWAADAAAAVARDEVTPLPTSQREAVGELVAARLQVRRFGVLVNQAVAALHATGQPPTGLASAVSLCSRAVVRLDEATVRLVARS